MKVLIFLVIISAFVAYNQAQWIHGNPLYTGQPGCQTEEEITVALYPHFRNKSAYWICSVLGQPASFELCPIGQGFLAPEKACVPWANWYWTPTEAPPSSPLTVTANNANEEQQKTN